MLVKIEIECVDYNGLIASLKALASSVVRCNEDSMMSAGRQVEEAALLDYLNAHYVYGASRVEIVKSVVKKPRKRTVTGFCNRCSLYCYLCKGTCEACYLKER